MADQQWLTVAQVATQLQVHPETVRRWLRDGRLIGRNFGGKSGYRIRREDFEKFLKDDPLQKSAEDNPEPEGATSLVSS